MTDDDSINETEWDNKAIAAAKLWCENEIVPIHAMYEFAEWLGDSHPNPYNRDKTIQNARGAIVNIFNPEVRHKIDMILGPNGKALLKVMGIRREQS